MFGVQGGGVHGLLDASGGEMKGSGVVGSSEDGYRRFLLDLVSLYVPSA